VFSLVNSDHAADFHFSRSLQVSEWELPIGVPFLAVLDFDAYDFGWRVCQTLAGFYDDIDFLLGTGGVVEERPVFQGIGVVSAYLM
jgi:hypothetical protein